MAEAITIPSPAAFLTSPREPPTQPAIPKQPPRSSAAPKSTSSFPDGSAITGSAVTKRKQSKSRNGCITCKAKRLKCDETKPSCQQCAKRSVTCGGYKKDFKWRPFEESNFAGTGKAAPAKLRKASSPPNVPPAPTKPRHPPVSDPLRASIDGDGPFPQFAQHQQPQMQMPLPSFMDPNMSGFFAQDPSPFMLHPPPFPEPEPFEPESTTSTTSMFNDAETVDTLQSTTTAASSLSSGQSPRLIDLLLPGTDMHAPPPDFIDWRAQYPDEFFPTADFSRPNGSFEDEGIEEIARQPNLNPDHEAWVMRLPSPAPSSSSSSSNGSADTPRADPYAILLEPQFPQRSPEILTMRFDRQTCGILSVKDGRNENPWRTLVWPLARSSPALYHAIASMTAFHTSKIQPQLRVLGIEHMRSSIDALAQGIRTMRVDAAIATTLALAFSESWDLHTSTGINHIKGAKLLVSKALMEHRQTPLAGEDLSRLRFLCNTWVYMDVIARLTSVDDDESTDFDAINNIFVGPFEYEAQLDPLMGCASTLFPIIGRVANLVRRVRRCTSNSPAIISSAMELKTQLEDWVPQAFFEVPEDPTSQIQHSLQTAEAYRWATLLYLHQAVPEIPSLSNAELAKKVLIYLATVPLTSRAVIIHIYPLTAAGSEASNAEDREWVMHRWEAMSQRMVIGTLDRCLEIVKEVWSRRDAYETRLRRKSHHLTSSPTRGHQHLHSMSSPPQPLRRGMSEGFSGAAADGYGGDEPIRWNDNFVGSKRRATSSGLEGLQRPMRVSTERRRSDGVRSLPDDEYTIRGKLHWLSVMGDWGWEG
ncbi:hypothetical protein K490DRAFT_52067 [Saccharata proteae CBS 121410]|uniref:Zn(2)-C6 fungal-type domain-containing protein n=1 Tax=Saccharata proteae CBS 121410 TaxID=1314787 RepID=A0A9P4HMJ5_9PEZI|nr:hypothetical protein K490DRAFT_52067 [Saccharata proteae CBS 121410]